MIEVRIDIRNLQGYWIGLAWSPTMASDDDDGSLMRCGGPSIDALVDHFLKIFCRRLENLEIAHECHPICVQFAPPMDPIR